ncbi:hypothetical protein TNCV_1711901 [Trichonephila clavipes]|nr:hypothetical protein TNCV_1711901 [Trichonephila clavipes]
MNSSQHRCMNQAPASENQTQQRSLNSSLEVTVGSPLVHLGVKSCWKGTHFTSVEEVQAKTENLLKGLPKTLCFAELLPAMAAPNAEGSNFECDAIMRK